MEILFHTAEIPANIQSIILGISLSETKFFILKLFDLKRREISNIFDVKDEGRLWRLAGTPN